MRSPIASMSARSTGAVTLDTRELLIQDLTVGLSNKASKHETRVVINKGKVTSAKPDASLLADLYKLAGDCYNARGEMDAAIAAYQGELKDGEGP